MASNSNEQIQPYSCPHNEPAKCRFIAKNLQGLVRHLNTTHKGKTTTNMMNGPLAYRVICGCGNIGQSGSNCINCQYRMPTVELSSTANAQKTSAPKNLTPTTSSTFMLPEVSEEVMHELTNRPLATIPKLTVNSTT